MLLYEMMHDRCANKTCTNDHDVGVGAKVFGAAVIVDRADLFSPVGRNRTRDREFAFAGGHFGM